MSVAGDGDMGRDSSRAAQWMQSVCEKFHGDALGTKLPPVPVQQFGIVRCRWGQGKLKSVKLLPHAHGGVPRAGWRREMFAALRDKCWFHVKPSRLRGRLRGRLPRRLPMATLAQCHYCPCSRRWTGTARRHSSGSWQRRCTKRHLAHPLAAMRRIRRTASLRFVQPLDVLFLASIPVTPAQAASTGIQPAAPDSSCAAGKPSQENSASR